MRIVPLLAVALLALALGLSACGGGDGGGNDYPDEVVENFVTNCAAQPGATESACECAIDELQGRMSFEEFEAAEQALVTGGEVAPELHAVIEECKDA
jgi:hypothetical protein